MLPGMFQLALLNEVKHTGGNLHMGNVLSTVNKQDGEVQIHLAHPMPSIVAMDIALFHVFVSLSHLPYIPPSLAKAHHFVLNRRCSKLRSAVLH
jgi:hypothetical protein